MCDVNLDELFGVFMGDQRIVDLFEGGEDGLLIFKERFFLLCFGEAQLPH